ncbi:hypothetical protein [Ruegeria jejuensis]|uniref:hypothetical protein n=1 Tax=Ruegeria jejuensis TaxID=3233338 RepID=UPI00355C470A
MLCRLHPDQADSFAFLPAILALSDVQIAKYPDGRRTQAGILSIGQVNEQRFQRSHLATDPIGGVLKLGSSPSDFATVAEASFMLGEIDH